ncbi:hypothetical protein XELAEV_18011424mg [Xenopus laevis]|uniref:Purkinje cell protein 4 n=1 Tax=Xenopus laevis TaxID=8355 RepID=A0A974HXF8_XENLA|nr:hypothetical protein XELAEV_18011424mg [Xenopus laevis]
MGEKQRKPTEACGEHTTQCSDQAEIIPSSNTKSSLGDKDDQKKVQDDFDIDMEAPETERAAVAIQSQFRKFQKKKQNDVS